MTGYEMIGNLNTLNLVKFIKDKNIPTKINEEALAKSILVSTETYEVEFTEPNVKNRL